jgi:hypothetical protein
MEHAQRTFKRVRTLCLLLAMVGLASCATSGGGGPDGLTPAARRIQEMSVRTERLSDEVGRISLNLSKLVLEVGALKSRIEPAAGEGRPTVADEVRFIESELAKLGTRVERLEAAPSAPPAPVPVAPSGAPAAARVTVKVLAGARNLPEAGRLAARLVDGGYTVGSVDSSSSRIPVDTVYYADGFAAQAREIAALVGPGTVVKPMTWASVYPLIVVKGE